MDKFIKDLYGIFQDESEFFKEKINENGEYDLEEVIFGFGLLKLLNDSLRYFNEKDIAFIKPGFQLDYMMGLDKEDFEKYFYKLGELNSKYKWLELKNFGLDELAKFIDYNQKIYNFDEYEIMQFVAEKGIDPYNEFNKNEEAIAYYLTFDIYHFNRNIIEIFNKLNFRELIFKYEKKSGLSYILSRLNNIKISEKYFSSLKTFSNTLNDFIDKISVYVFTQENKTSFTVDDEYDVLRDDLLIELLFANLDLKKYKKINIYDPCCDNINLINKCIEFIKSDNKDCDVNYYGKLNFFRSILNTSKVIINSFLKNNIILSTSEDPGFPFEGISLKKMDLIISDFRIKFINKEKDLLNHISTKLDYSAKVVMIIDKQEFDNNFINAAILTDKLELIFTFYNYFILILNSNKSEDMKNKFLLMDYSLLDKEYLNKIEKDKFIIKKRHLKNSHINVEYIPKILETYTNLKNTAFSKVGDYNDIKDLPNGFNYNHIMYDLKRKPYSLHIQKNIGNNKSELIEEKLEFAPLYTLITFDPNEIDQKYINECKMEKFGEIFYVKPNKLLKNFLLYYMESGKGKEELNYFLNDFGFRVSHYKYATLENSKIAYVYMRIPLIDIESQEKIIKAYELNEEHYNLVKESRDNFLSNILDYEKVLKDMKNFNTMEIDTATGQIVKMNTVKRHMFDGLLWPLSISYLNAVHGTHVNNPNEKLDFYLKLFEFLTAFIDIVLISSIPKEDYDRFKIDLWKGISENKYFEATFGTWTNIYSKLLEFFSENNIQPNFNNELIERLLDADIFRIMNEARVIRNEFPGHGTSIHESRAKQLIDELKLKIDVVYNIFGYLTGFKLFYSVKVLELFDDGSNLYEVVSLNGPCDQPIYGKVTFNKRLKNDSLYLNNSLDGDLLELNKNLIIFEEVIEDYLDKNGQKKERATGRFYLYLFNGFKKKKNKVQMRYKCYQIETDEIRKNVSFGEWKDLM